MDITQLANAIADKAAALNLLLAAHSDSALTAELRCDLYQLKQQKAELDLAAAAASFNEKPSPLAARQINRARREARRCKKML